jgi:hypothetical protein
MAELQPVIDARLKEGAENSAGDLRAFCCTGIRMERARFSYRQSCSRKAGRTASPFRMF